MNIGIVCLCAFTLFNVCHDSYHVGDAQTQHHLFSGEHTQKIHTAHTCIHSQSKATKVAVKGKSAQLCFLCRQKGRNPIISLRSLVEHMRSGARQGHTWETQLELKVVESSGSDFSASKTETGPFTNPPPLSSPQTLPHKTALFLRHTHKHTNACTHSPLRFLPFHSTNYLLSQHFWLKNSTRTSWLQLTAWHILYSVAI